MLSFGPNPGSKLVYAPPVGRFVPKLFTVLGKIPVKPFIVMLRTPQALRTNHMLELAEPLTAFNNTWAALKVL